MKVLPGDQGGRAKVGFTGVGGSTSAPTAEDIPFTPGGTLSSTNVQDAIAEAAAEAASGSDIPQSIFAAKGDILTATANDTPAILTVGTNGYRLKANSGATNGIEWVADYAMVPWFLSGGSAVLSTGLAFWLGPFAFAGVIEQVTIDAFESGSIVIDIGKAAETTWAGTHFASICASAKPTLSSARRATDSTLTGWTTSISAGDMLTFNVDSVTSIKRISGMLKVRKT